ncbi:hypothetical protein [Streptomyces sp. cg36]|uniref:hypothetical protein n=1 Tax=Streptomyces sp. cg36 TaxID=3238798 RepID=UPI0034E277FF
MSTEPTAHHYARQAEGVRQIAAVLRTYPELHTVELASPVGAHPLAELAAINPNELDQDADELATEAAYAERTAEINQRAAEAGTRNRAARCTEPGCGHSGINHSDRITEDGRIPCAMPTCRCSDLTFEAAGV